MRYPTSNISSQRILCIGLLGPTGSGKTALCLSLDPMVFEIIICDSRQIYKGLEISTAAPTKIQQDKIPHHLVSIVQPTVRFTAGDFVDLAIPKIREISSRGKIPVLVGGTGFYYKALSKGLFPIQSDGSFFRERVIAMNELDRIEELRRLDPGALFSENENPTGKIHPNDAYRIIRALEVTLSTGKPWSEFNRQHESPDLGIDFKGYWLSLDREILKSRIRERARQMVEQGFRKEVIDTWNLYGDCPGLSSLGAQFLLDDLTQGDDVLVEHLSQSHIQYAKKQRTWFRGQKELQSVDPDQFLLLLKEDIR